jgi:hypothetical protein
MLRRKNWQDASYAYLPDSTKPSRLMLLSTMLMDNLYMRYKEV